ncbi:hypothetical protein MMC29_000154 [Sticta canariensis]|nr:hypothetical protein [Sticta canariensis]
MASGSFFFGGGGGFNVEFEDAGAEAMGFTVGDVSLEEITGEANSFVTIDAGTKFYEVGEVDEGVVRDERDLQR